MPLSPHESPAKWRIWGLHADVDQIEPDRRIRRNWAFRRRLHITAAPPPSRHSRVPSSHSCAPLPSFLRRQEPSLDSGDQILTEVDTRLTELDTRLTKVDKGCQSLTPSTPPRTPNNPEQIRTNLNKPEHRRTPRPDREPSRITPTTPKKNKPRTPPPPTATSHPLRHSRTPHSVIPAPPPVIPAQAGTHPPQHPPLFPNSSLPPGRGEVRWGVGGNERPPAVVSRPNRPLHTLCRPCRPTAIPAHPPRHSRTPHSVIPAPPPVIPAQAGTHPPQHSPLFPNSSLPPKRGEVRWGVGGNKRPPTVVSCPNRPLHTPCRPCRPSDIPAHPPRHSCPPPPSFPHAPFRHSCAGRNPPTPTPTPLPQFIPPPSQGGG